MARDIAKTEAYQTSRRQRKKVEMLFALLKPILKLDRLRVARRSGWESGDNQGGNPASRHPDDCR